MDADPVALADRQLEAYNAQDVAAFVACFAEDVEVFDLPGDVPTLVGRRAMAQRYGALFAAQPGQRCEILQRIVHGPFVIDHERIEGRADGRSLHAVAIYQVAGETIRRVWFPRA